MEDIQKLIEKNQIPKVTVMLDDRFFSEKPEGKEIPGIVSRLKTQEITIPELALRLNCGYSCRPGLLVGGVGDASWVGQQCFFLDIDESITVDDALEICIKRKIVPNIIYPSFHYKPDAQRFRMVFIADKVIENAEVRDEAQKELIRLFSCDERTSARSRLFFGGNILFWQDNQARFNVENFLEGGERDV